LLLESDFGALLFESAFEELLLVEDDELESSLFSLISDPTPVEFS
jgi:hypothetical protein